MYNIQLLNKIAKVGTNNFCADKYNVGEDVANPDAIMVRSAAMHDMQFNPELKAIARAGAGVNNIPVDRCAEEGIVVFNTPGANANAVKELVICGLMLASRDVIGGAAWAKNLEKTEEADVAKQVEKGKSKFGGCEIAGKKLGVIGLGAIGALVANAANDLHMEVIGYDNYMTIDAAWRLSRKIEKAASLDEIFEKCDYITVHVPSTPETRGMFNAENIAKMKDGVRFINLSRGDLANVPDLIEALESGKVASYVTDFPSEELLGLPNVVCIPHLGASTPESEDNCAVMAAEQLIDYIENGNIRNSVNYPEIQLPRAESNRIVVLHDNVPNIITQISGALAKDNVNIESLLSQAKGNNAVSIFDTNDHITDAVVADIGAIQGVVRVLVR